MWQLFADGKLIGGCDDSMFPDISAEVRAAHPDAEITAKWQPEIVNQVITVLNLFATDGEMTARAIQRYMTDADSDFDFDEIIKWMEMLRDGDEI